MQCSGDSLDLGQTTSDDPISEPVIESMTMACSLQQWDPDLCLGSAANGELQPCHQIAGVSNKLMGIDGKPDDSLDNCMEAEVSLPLCADSDIDVRNASNIAHNTEAKAAHTELSKVEVLKGQKSDSEIFHDEQMETNHSDSPRDCVSTVTPLDRQAHVPCDSNVGVFRLASEQLTNKQLPCRPEIESSIEAVVEMLLENSKHLPGFTQIIEQAAHSKQDHVTKLGSREKNEVFESTMVVNDASGQLEPTGQDNKQVMLTDNKVMQTEEQPSSSCSQDNLTKESGSAPASSEVQRILDALLHTASGSQEKDKITIPKKVGKGRKCQTTKKTEEELTKMHKCPECDKLFPRASSLKRHILLHMDDRPYQCTECDANYKSYSQLKRHTRIHTGEKPAKCEYCHKTFRTYNELYVHRRTHTGEKPFECKFCGKCFSTRGYRNTHERIHTGEKRFECDFCGMKFTESSARRVHRFTHTGETPYKCEVCGRGFTQAGNLGKHMKTLHSKIKPFKCQDCGKDFAVKQELTRHFSRIHSSDKPHECKECGKRYAIYSDLTQHMFTHKNRCSNCGVKFKNKEGLERHVIEDCLISGYISPATDTEGVERKEDGAKDSEQTIEPAPIQGKKGCKRTRKSSGTEVREQPSQKSKSVLSVKSKQLSASVSQKALSSKPSTETTLIPPSNEPSSSKGQQILSDEQGECSNKAIVSSLERTTLGMASEQSSINFQGQKQQSDQETRVNKSSLVNLKTAQMIVSEQSNTTFQKQSLGANKVDIVTHTGQSSVNSITKVSTKGDKKDSCQEEGERIIEKCDVCGQMYIGHHIHYEVYIPSGE